MWHDELFPFFRRLRPITESGPTSTTNVGAGNPSTASHYPLIEQPDAVCDGTQNLHHQNETDPLTPAPAHSADPAPKVGDETPTLGLDRNELGALVGVERAAEIRSPR